MTQPADHELAQRAVRRDSGAVQSFAERVACVPAFLRRCAQRSGVHLPPAALDDLTQETYLSLWRKLPDYRGESRLETWACGFAHIELRRWREREARHAERRSELDEDPAEELELADDTVELVEQAIERLGPPTSVVMRLKHVECLTFDTIGARMDLPASTAKSLYYRGLAKLRDWLGHLEEESAG